MQSFYILIPHYFNVEQTFRLKPEQWLIQDLLRQLILIDLVIGLSTKNILISLTINKVFSTSAWRVTGTVQYPAYSLYYTVISGSI